jgi:hypothetical protein
MSLPGDQWQAAIPSHQTLVLDAPLSGPVLVWRPQFAGLRVRNNVFECYKRSTGIATENAKKTSAFEDGRIEHWHCKKGVWQDTRTKPACTINGALAFRLINKTGAEQRGSLDL